MPELRLKKLGFSWRILLTPEVGVLIPILLLVIITSILSPAFLTRRYLSSILVGSVFIGACSLGQAIVIMSGEIDLSVGFTGCLSGIIIGKAAMTWGLPAFPCVALGLLTGTLVGLVNGLMVSRLGLSGWITTIATQFITKGLATTIAQGVPQSIASLNLSKVATNRPLGLSWLFFILLAVIVIMDFVIRRSKFGYQLRATGGNREAAEMAGIDIRNVKLLAFMLSGFFAAMGGLFDVLNANAASEMFGEGREFRTIICCAVGGISLAGGEGSIYGVALGVLLFHVLWFCLRILNVNPNMQLVLIGVILILSVVLDFQRKRLQARKMV
jgi:ribose transport system permease protein